MELSKYLRPEHREAGLELYLNMQGYLLKAKGKNLRQFPLSGTLLEVLDKADQYLEMSKAVEFAKEK